MPETFDFAATNPASGGENLAGDRFTQAGTPVFLPAAYLVFGPAGGPFTRVDSAAGLPVAVQNAPLAVTQSGPWTVGVSGDLDVRDLAFASDSVTAHQGGAWAVRLQDGSGTALTSAARGSERALSVQLVDAAGGQVTSFGGGTEYTDGDTDATPTGVLIMYRKESVNAMLAVGDDHPLPVDVQNAVPVTDNSGSLTVDDGGDSLTVDGTVTVSGTVTVDSELPAAVALADALANPTTPPVGACNLLWNGSTWDRRPGTQEGALLASASRSATTSSATRTNHGARGVVVWLDLSAFNGGTGLTLQLWAVDPVGGRAGLLASWGPRSNPAQVHWLELSPGCAAGAAADAYGFRVAGALPRQWFVTVSHATATAHTYGVSYSLLP